MDRDKKKCISLKERRITKQIQYERCVLRDIRLAEIRRLAKRELLSTAALSLPQYAAVERILIDYAIEVYLYGASFGRWGYYGESFAQIKERTKGKEGRITEELYAVVCRKLYFPKSFSARQHLYVQMQKFMDFWLQKGFGNGMKRYKLKMLP